MCGIIGILGKGDVAPLIVEGLKRLEYRGYDSSGVATIDHGMLDRRRASGKLQSLVARLEKNPLKGATGIGHTRWATHGAATDENAHPHATERLALVSLFAVRDAAAWPACLAAHDAACKSSMGERVYLGRVDRVLLGGGARFDWLAIDAFPSREFDFMLSNPPYGKSWKSDLERMGGKDGTVAGAPKKSAALTPEQQRILESRGVLSPAEIHALASKTRKAVGADAGKASCHSDYVDPDAAQHVQRERGVVMPTAALVQVDVRPALGIAKEDRVI